MSDRQLVIVDADMLAGWRRPSPRLEQLWEAVDYLHAQAPDALVTVVADPALKWALDEDERQQFERDVATGRLAHSPAGSVGGHVGFLAQVVRKARDEGLSPVVVTDQAVSGARLSRVRREGARWVFDLEGVEARTVEGAAPRRRRRRGGGSSAA